MAISPTVDSWILPLSSDVPKDQFRQWAIAVEQGVTDALASNAAAGVIGVNLLINGDFRVNQRGYAAETLSAGAFCLDRWKAAVSNTVVSGAGPSITLVSGEIAQDVEPLLFGLTSLAGATLTLSMVNNSNDLTVTIGNQIATLTPGAGRRDVSVTLGAGETGNVTVKIKQTTGASVTFGQVKLEIGGVPTAFVARDAITELQLCRRYFYRRNKSGNFDVIGMGSAYTNARFWGVSFVLPVTMRASPTVSISNIADIRAYVGAEYNLTSISLAANRNFVWAGDGTTVGTPLSVGDAVMVFFANANPGYIDFNAEL